jgi:hypothetical protein
MHSQQIHDNNWWSNRNRKQERAAARSNPTEPGICVCRDWDVYIPHASIVHQGSSLTNKTRIIFMLGMLGYTNYVYLTYIVGAFHKFPEEVAKPLRRAMFYTNIQEDPQKALKYFKESLRVIEEIRMDPFSNEVLGVKIQLAALFEKYHHHALAIQVLEQVRKDCFKYIELLGDKHMNDGQRTRVLGKTVAIGIKLGELYSSAAVDDQEAAETVLISAVETMLLERQRREREGNQPGEQEWATDEENGATLEGKSDKTVTNLHANSYTALGTQFESTNKHHLAAPLFLQAIALCPPKSCHRVILSQFSFRPSPYRCPLIHIQ